MLVGGIFHRNQRYSTESTQAHSTLLFLAVIGIAIPTSAGHVIISMPQDVILQISHVSAIVMLFCYLCYLFFQLVTHPESGSGEEGGGDEEEAVGRESLELDVPAEVLTVPTAIGCLLVISVLVALHCEWVMGAHGNWVFPTQGWICSARSPPQYIVSTVPPSRLAQVLDRRDRSSDHRYWVVPGLHW